MIQLDIPGVTLNDREIVGRATVTIVASSAAMKLASDIEKTSRANPLASEVPAENFIFRSADPSEDFTGFQAV
jgi:hypothetical protein